MSTFLKLQEPIAVSLLLVMGILVHTVKESSLETKIQSLICLTDSRSPVYGPRGLHQTLHGASPLQTPQDSPNLSS
jgi:hypothetical protein